MKKTILAFIILTFFNACGQQNIPNTAQQHDKIASNSASKVDQDFIKTLALLKESNLRDDTPDKHEFRFYYFPSFESYKFFKLNYADSTLVFKEFMTKKPDGSGENKLISSKTLKFFPKDFKRLKIAIDKSLFWSLQSETPKLSIDGSLYIYESRQPIPENLRSIEKDYHIVKYNSPTNADFVNLGQFFLFLTGHKNTYHN